MRNIETPHLVGTALACAVAIVLLAFTPVRADEPGTGAADPIVVPIVPDHCTGEVGERIAFIEERLEGARRWSNWWWKGWTGGYAFGTLLTSAQAATEGDTGDRAVSVVSAVKAAFGTTRLYIYQPTARRGADPLGAAPPGDAAACQRRLDLAEQRLHDSAHETGRAFRWKSHIFNVALNSLGAVVAGEGWGSRGEAWTSAGIGVVVGELQIWTQPRQPVTDLAEYEQHFSGTAASVSSPGLALSVIPMGQGAALRLSF